MRQRNAAASAGAVAVGTSRVRLLFIVESLQRASARVRASNLVPVLRQHGIDATVTELPKGTLGRLRLLPELRRFDVVVLCRRLLPRVEQRLLRAFSRRLVFDFDDAIFLRNAANRPGQPWESPTRRRRFAQICGMSDLVIAGNEYLAAEARKYQARVEILPSAVPASGIPVKDYAQPNARPIVGWVGSRDTLQYLEGLRPVLLRAHQRQPFDLHVISNGRFALPGINCQNIPWQLESQEREIARFDVGLMPLTDDPWSRGKCAYKLLQYLAAAVPFVASAVGMNVEVAAGGTTGFAVATEGEFADKLVEILQHAELRERMGRAGRNLVCAKYSVDAVGSMLAGEMKALMPR